MVKKKEARPLDTLPGEGEGGGRMCKAARPTPRVRAGREQHEEGAERDAARETGGARVRFRREGPLKAGGEPHDALHGGHHRRGSGRWAPRHAGAL